jgi:hypothetical protein
MELDMNCCYRGVQTPAAALCSGLQHNTAAAAAAYLQQQLLSYNPTTVATGGLQFAAIKQTAPAFATPLGERDNQLKESAVTHRYCIRATN